jgi:chorismate mutase
MAGDKESLKDLRRQIDAIDDALHDLIVRRTEVVEKVRDIKRHDKVKIRPDREAEILYRLLARHRGPFPRRPLVRIWREIIVATLSFEGPFSVAVLAGEADFGCWDLARDHFGGFTPMTRYATARRVIEAVTRGEAQVGVLPLPASGETDPWWRHLVNESEGAPRVIARLPFAGPGNAWNPNREALAIAPIAQESTGRDRSLAVIDAGAEIGRDRLAALLKTAGLPATPTASWHDEHKPEVWLHLIEVDDFAGVGDPRLGRLVAAAGGTVQRVVSLGGYAVPFAREELETTPAAAAASPAPSTHHHG